MRKPISLLTTLIFVALLQACNFSTEKLNCDDCPKNPCPEVENTNEIMENSEAYNSFDCTVKGTIFYKKMMVPYKFKLETSGEQFKIMPKVIKRKGFLINNKQVLLEVLQHGDSDRDDISNFPKSTELQSDDISKYLKTYNPANTVYIISIHDEDYKRDEIEIEKVITKVLSNCNFTSNFDDCIEIIQAEIAEKFNFNKNSNFKPKTVGGGVIPPGS